MKGHDGTPLTIIRRAAAVLCLVVALSAAPAAAVRVCTYNILNFPGSDGSTRVDDFRTVLEEVDADVLVVQEMLSQSGVNQFLNEVMNYSTPGLYAAGPFVNGPDTDNALFYKPAVVEFVSHQEIATSLRNISEYVLRPVGYSSEASEFRVYSLHLKAGATSSDQDRRLSEATTLREHLNDLPPGSAFMVAGDLNIRASTEDAYQKLVGSEADNDGRSKDPIDRPGTWHDNSAFADIHTQSTRTTAFGGGATGGLDDRFDQILISYALADGEGMDFIPGTHVAYGNDGLHLNVAINYGTNYAVGPVIADALHQASDHIPLYADFQVPAKIDAPASVDFGNAIVGTYVCRAMTIANVAVPPADELSYTLSIPAGFSGSSGPFELDAATSADHDIAMDTGSTGSKSGTLAISSDDPDYPNWSVSLSGAVLDHAVPSLDSAEVVLADTVDFGSHPLGEFGEEAVLVWNVDYSATRAVLEVYDAEISGGSGRFTFVGGFAPQDAADAAAEYSIAFDDSGATEDSLYTALLTFHTRDDPEVQGATDLDDLSVTLKAYVEGGTSVPDDASGPSFTLASHNPFDSEVALVLALPDGCEATVEIYDIAGRLVKALHSGALGSRGPQRLVWDGTDRAGRRVASGIYFARAHTSDWSAARKLVVIR